MQIFKKKIPNDEFWSNLPIVDIEVGNDVRETMPDGRVMWINENAIITCTGILERDRMEFVIAESEHELEYKVYLMKRLGALPYFYSFNTEFEKCAFMGFLKKRYDCREIKPFSVRHGSKENLFKLLVKHKLVKTDVVDPYHNDGLLCVRDWQDGKYKEVVAHNTNCLLKESALLRHKEFFTSNFRSFNGWLIKKERDRFWMELGIKEEKI